MTQTLSMDITGYDTVVFSCTPGAQLVPVLFAKVRKSWPALTVDVELLDSEQELSQIHSGEECAHAIKHERHPIMYFFRDAQMRLHLENCGYVLDPVKEGPFAVHLRKRSGVLFALSAVAEVASDDKTVGVIDPYEGWLCSREILEITIVTPHNPKADPFSQWALDQVINSCLGKP